MSSLGQAFKQATRGGRIAVAFLSLLNILARKAPKVKEKQTKKIAQGKKKPPLAERQSCPPAAIGQIGVADKLLTMIKAATYFTLASPLT